MAGLRLLVLLAALCSAAAAKVPLGCSVIMYRAEDYKVVNGRSMCIQTVENARKTCGGNRINFVPTLFYVVNTLADPSKTLKRYCAAGGAGCPEINSQAIRAFRDGMAACFKRAVALGFTTLEVTPHLDDAEGASWRNSVAINPTQKYGKYRYIDVVVVPLAAAFHAVLSPKVQVYFAMQGEMGATVVRHAKAWLPVIKAVKGAVTEKAKARLAGNVKVGVSTNWNKLCGCGSDTLGIDPDVYINNFEKKFDQVAKTFAFDVPAIRALFTSVDFVGISYYPYKAEKLTPQAFEYGMGLYARELKLYGIDLQRLIKRGIQFRLHEYGLGGGICGEGTCPAPAKRLLQWPFFGISGSYQKKMDPFLLWKPARERVPQREQLRAFWVASLRWFSKGGGPRYKIQAVYCWSSGSWDVTGTNPSTPSAEGTWRDPPTAQRIKAYNDKGIVP